MSETGKMRAPSGRSKARELAMWALYQRQITGQDARAVYNQFLQEGEGNRLDLDLVASLVREYIEEMENASPEEFNPRYFSGLDPRYFKELTLEIPPLEEQLEELLSEFADRPMAQLDPVERAILFIGAYELKHRPDVPYRVVINEAVELAKFYGAEDGHRYVNAILDKASARLRAVEHQARRRPR